MKISVELPKEIQAELLHQWGSAGEKVCDGGMKEMIKLFRSSCRPRKSKKGKK